MTNTPLLLSELPEDMPGSPPSGRRGRLWPAALSLGLHAALFALALVLGLAGGADGPDGTGLRLAGYVSLGGDSQTGQHAADAAGSASASVAEPASAPEKAPAIPPENKTPEATVATLHEPAISVPARDARPERRPRPAKAPPRKAESPSPSPAASPQAHSSATPGAQPSGSAAVSAAAGPGNGNGPGAGTGPAGQGGGGKPGFGYSLADVDTRPVIVSKVDVRYPRTARVQRLTGEVMVRFHLSEQGTISRLHVLRADPPDIFDESALAAVRQWKFAPAMKDGRPVPVWVNLPLPFFLK